MEKVDVNHRYTEVTLNDDWKNAYGEDYWEYRRNWNEYPTKKIVSKFPLHLDIEITNSCNLLCPFCPRTMMLQKGILGDPYFVSLDIIKKAIDMGKNIGLKSVNLNSAGETLMHKEIPEMVRYAKKSGVLDVMFHTNATLLTETLAEDLIDSGLDKLIVSFDSPNPSRYNKLRLGAEFYDVYEKVKKVSELKKSKKSLLPIIRINMVVMKENEHEIDEMIKLWDGIANSVGFLGYINPMGLDDKERGTVKKRDRSSFVCEKLWQRLTITHEGNIKLCHMDEKNMITLGNIYEDDISEIWTGDKLEKIRGKHLSGNTDDIAPCAVCGLAEVE